MSSRERMLVGLNLPWSRFGADFGVRQPWNTEFWPSDGVPAWRATIDDDLRELREIGFRALRWWLLGDGGHYGQLPQLDEHGVWQMDYRVGARPTRSPGGMWLVDSPSPLPAQFMEDFIFMVQAINNAGMKVIPVLIGFEFGFDGDATSRTLVKGGRYELINDEVKRRQFLSAVLRPLVQGVHVAGLDNAIYAWDLINEPEWCTEVFHPHILRSLWEAGRGQIWRGMRHANVRQQSMRAYIQEGASIINSAGFRSTVGFVAIESPQSSSLHPWDDATLGVTLHQFHFRDPLSDLPPHNSNWTSAFPCFIGEISDGRRLVTPLREQGLYDRLRIIEDRGYSAAFIWPEDKPHVDPFRHLDPQDIADIRRYVSGR